ncbi:DNA mismatch repair endonuclease MutL [Faecalibacterium sp. BIOML-A3]|uniref:DNA mismatch repair endonuclease MutL n=1 Tax=unclassified Faecalibacterium TaxID=2646395 RepID=UPI0012AF82E3|nr:MULTISPECIES: DNA mismatch repair endonuclease MutL [unclassified Faecalibacterium]MSD29216.1 DNA mismatch repair endonuclease MutL [Faecalibacterium sp. BIOML-A4]MSD47365.1 DNA mismatch repair endonuclease MutL [Faecalibacterium sp. BIOML-A3]
MAVIHVLDKHTAELIAAGEVVERPASVVKELLENSIDAGATQVTVSIESGGVKLIEISDNGTGIEAEYISTAFIRHATSKIETPDDLTNIHTLGFRGEALASIASVARVELTTRTEVDEFATVYRIEGGEEVSREPGARAVGTTIRVKDLFYNTPARMKFLKKDSSEGTFVSDTVTHVALSHPEVSVKFIREGKLQYVTPGDGQLRGAAYAVLGREFSRDLIELKNQEGVYRITGLITPPKSCRASRSMQHFYINGRYVRNRTMMAGMEMAFKGTMMQGKFPGGILLLEMPADLVDVNVHPAKIEARFARENDVFDVVYHAVKLALAQPGTGERLFTFEADKEEEKAGNSKKDTDIIKNDVKNNNFTGLSAIIRGQADPGVLPQQHWEPAKPAAAPQQPAPSAAMQIPTAPSEPRWKGSAQNEDMRDPFVTLHSPKLETTKAPEPFRAAASETQLDVEPEFGETKLHSPQDHMAAWNPAQEAPKEEPESAPCAETEPDAPEAAEQKTVLAEPEQMNFDPTADQPEPLRYVGEVFRTYILAERGDELCLIDKHAAHERQLYEKLAANYGNVPSQMLLEPAAIDLAAEEKQALLDNIPLLENAGLEVADFGGNTVVLRAVPADVEPQNAESLLVEIANKLLKGGHDALNEHTEWVLHSISCRAAIKAGDKSSPQELLALAEKILSGEVPPFCPHGRPCVLKLTRKELEKQFGRIV